MPSGSDSLEQLHQQSARAQLLPGGFTGGQPGQKSADLCNQGQLKSALGTGGSDAAASGSNIIQLSAYGQSSQLPTGMINPQ